MGKVILNLAQSLDGYICRLDGTVDFLDDANSGDITDFNDFLETVEVVIMGRTTYEEYKSYGYGYLDGKEVFIWTTKPKESENNLHFYSGDIPSLVEKYKDKTIWCFGGTRVITEFIKHDLIDEFQIATVPKVIGSGKRLFEPGEYEYKLKIKDSKYTNSFLLTTYVKDE